MVLLTLCSTEKAKSAISGAFEIQSVEHDNQQNLVFAIVKMIRTLEPVPFDREKHLQTRYLVGSTYVTPS